MKNHTRWALLSCVLMAALFLGAGCSKSIDSGAEVFQNASPEVKQGWDSAMAAMKTNGYAAALITLQQVRALPGVTIEQGKAIDESATRINTEMYESANREEPAGKAALEEMRKFMGR